MKQDLLFGDFKVTSLSPIELEKTLNILILRHNKGLSQFELSFLMGQRNYYVRDSEDLNKTLVYSIPLSNIFRQIFDCSIEAIVPHINKDPKYSIRVLSAIDKTGKTIYKAERQEENGEWILLLTFSEEDKNLELPTPLKLRSFQELKDFIFHLYSTGYFDNTRTALEVFTECRKEENFGKDFHPRNMIKALNYYTNQKSGELILDNSRTNLFPQRLFFKPFNFQIDQSKGDFSKLFVGKNIGTFQEAAKWVSDLLYRRNIDKTDSMVLFSEGCGTCSTKHALLKRLADENLHPEPKLLLGIFMMNAKNTPAIKNILAKYNLNYIPEAHNYFKIHNYMLDLTGVGIHETKFELDLLEEIEIKLDQIGDFKVRYHRDYLDRWIKENRLVYSLEEIWRIREECIRVLADFKNKKQTI